MENIIRESIKSNGIKQTKNDQYIAICTSVLLASKFNDTWDWCLRTDHLINYINKTYVFLNIKEEDVIKYEVKALQILDSDLWKVVPNDFIDEFKTMRKNLQPSGKGSFVNGSDRIEEITVNQCSDKQLISDFHSHKSMHSSRQS
jgi:hypothetical protein